MGGLRLALLTVAALLLAAAPASAKPGFLGTGHDPGVAVDDAGTAHVAWFAENPETLEYCQVPRGKRACAVRQTFSLGAESGTAKVQVLVPRAGQVIIVAPQFNAPGLMLTSADNGATFAPHPMGQLLTIQQSVFGPGELVALVSNTGPARFARYGLDGAGPPEWPVEFAEATDSLETSLASYGPGYAVFFSGRGMASALWTGLGDPNLQQSWVEGPRLGEDRTTPAAMGGPSGTYVAYVNRRGGGSDIRVRRLSKDRLQRSKRLSRDDPASLAGAQGPRGDMVVLWRTTRGAAFVRSRKGKRWTRPRLMFRGHEPVDLRPVLGRRGGWMVWDSSAGNLGSNPIRIAAIPRAPRR